jgi:uncharacterized membrane protein required for colicin V production
MSAFDIVLLVILVMFSWHGFSAGLIKMVGSFVGLFGGAFLASHFYETVFQLTKNWFGGLDYIGRVVCFVVLLIVASRLIYLLFVLLDKTYNLLSIIPFLKSINLLAGGILGLLVGASLLGLLLYVTAKFAPSQTLIGGWLLKSQIAPSLLKVAQILLPVISGGLKDIKSII